MSWKREARLRRTFLDVKDFPHRSPSRSRFFDDEWRRLHILLKDMRNRWKFSRFGIAESIHELGEIDANCVSVLMSLRNLRREGETNGVLNVVYGGVERMLKIEVRHRNLVTKDPKLKKKRWGSK